MNVKFSSSDEMDVIQSSFILQGGRMERRDNKNPCIQSGLCLHIVFVFNVYIKGLGTN